MVRWEQRDVTTGKEQEEFNEMATTISWGKKVKEIGGMKKGKGKEKEGGWVEAANPWKMW